ncbi:MAG: tetratricopeptide repeat protein [Sandaracinaceae bacterium]
MADPKDKPKEREDQTAELSLGDLVPVAREREDQTMDLELEGVEIPPAPPKPGLGRPRRARSNHDKTLGAMPTPSRPPPPPTPRTSKAPPPTPTTPKKKRKAPKKKAKGKTSLPPPPPKPAAAPATAPSEARATPEAQATPEPDPATTTQPFDAQEPAPSPNATATEATAEATTEAAVTEAPAKKKKKPKKKRPAAKRALPKRAPPQAEAAPAIEAPETVPETDASAEELRDLCLAQLDTDATPERKARLHFELGRLHELDLSDLNKAAEHYQAALRLTPEHCAAIRGARRALSATERHATLPALYDAEAALTRDPASRAQLLHEKARVMEVHLRQSQPALVVYREALALDPGNVTYLKSIERALRRDKKWPELAETFGALAQAVDDPGLRAAWLSARAEITETHLAQPEAAAALYEAAFAADPQATGALAHIKRLAPPLARWGPLVEALEVEVRLTKERGAKDSTRRLIAELQADQLDDPAGAIDTLTASLGGSDDRRVLTRIAQLHRRRGRARDEAAALAQLIEHLDEAPERADVALRLGELHEQPLEDPDRALPWYRRCLDDDPTHRDAAHALLRVHETRGRWTDVIDVLGAQLAGRSSAVGRAGLRHRMGTLYEHRLEQPDDAVREYIAALALDPSHTEAFRDLTRLYAGAGQWRELAELYARAVDRARHDGEAIAWLFRWGGVLEDRLDEPGEAVAVYRRILERDPTHLGALHAAQRAAERGRSWATLVDLLEAEAKLETQPDTIASLLLRAARVTATSLDDPNGAAARIDRILQRAPHHRPSLEALAGLLNEAGRWQELVGVYKTLLPLTSTEAEKVRLHYRVGQILETQLAQPEPAVQAYRQALTLDRGFRPARQALATALEHAGQWSELAALLEGRLNARRGLDKAHAATELGLLRERSLNDADGALEAYELALEAAPQYRPALDARARLLAETQEWTKLSEALRAESDAAEDAFVKGQAALRAAEVRASQQGAVGPAIEAFQPLLDNAPNHLGALLAIETIYARAHDAEGLCTTLGQLANAVNDPRAQLAALRELARTEAAQGRDNTATQRRVLALAPDDPSALAALADAASGADAPTELSMHARLATGASDPSVGAFHQCRVGEIMLTQNDPLGALAAFRAAIALDPRSLSATRGLTRAARASKDPTALRQAARHEADVTQDRAVAVALLLQAALTRREASETDEAAKDYELALQLDPDHPDAARGLAVTRLALDQVDRLTEQLTRAAHEATTPERQCELHTLAAQLHADHGHDLGAAIASVERALSTSPNASVPLARLANYLTRSERWEQAAATLERLIPRAKDDALIDAHLRLASIAEDHLADPARAIRSYRAVLSRDDGREDALAGLVRLERVAGRDEEALRLVRRLLEVVDTPIHRAEALAQLAELEAARNQPEAAAEAALEAIGIAGTQGDAADVYQDLIDSGTAHATWDGYVNALTTYLTQPDAEAAPTYRELARVFGESHNRPDRAIATLREGTEACPGDASIALALADSLRALSADDKATAEIRRLLAANVTAAEGWRALRGVFQTEVDGSAVALAPLVALGVANEDERRVVDARTPRPAEAPAAILIETGLKQLCEHGALDEDATALVRILSDVFAKLEGFDADEWDLTRRDRIRQGDAHAVRQIADRIAPIFGVSDYDLYVTDAHGLDRAVIVPGSPPALLVGASIETADDVELTFHLARPLALYARYLHSIDLLPNEDVARVLAAAARHFEHDVPIADFDAADLEEETRRVGKAIGFFSRGRIQEGVAAFAEHPPRDIDEWLTDLRRMANRAALLVCDDLVGALRAHGGTLGEDPVADDLARFWASDPAMRYRRAIAQALPPTSI